MVCTIPAMWAQGSSPHARGALPLVVRAAALRGIIPACAGSTARGSAPTQAPRDHPRMRGEHLSWSTFSCITPGSSPHARGARARPRLRPDRAGIIPACAGSTRLRRVDRPGDGDHPRMRGEHFMAALHTAVDQGSSPHARGAPILPSFPRCGSRIIPACAGSTGRERRDGRPLRDHPRMRGEHTAAEDNAVTRRGSSPHARGAHWSDVDWRSGWGIIPACAGSTSITSRSWPRIRDHPRMRGEHFMASLHTALDQGSSPHARGARFGEHQQLPLRGIIPACAGSTSV